MRTLQAFGRDDRFPEYTPIQNKSNIQQSNKTIWDEQQVHYIEKLKKNTDSKCIKYLSPEMSLKKFEIVRLTTQIGEEYTKQLLSVELNDEESTVVLYGYTQELNVFNQVVAGEPLDDLKLLIDAITKYNADVNMFFDDNGEYIIYDKVKSFMKMQ